MGASGPSSDGHLSLRRSLAASRCVLRRPESEEQGHAGRARLGLPRSDSTGRRGIQRPSRESRTWKQSYRPLQWSKWLQLAVPDLEGAAKSGRRRHDSQQKYFRRAHFTGSVIRKLSDEEMNVYRKPFTQPGESRRPMLTWPREIPLEGEPENVTAIAQGYSEWLASARCPSCSSMPTRALS